MVEQTPTTSRVMLVVIDESAEHHVALRFAALRAAHTGGRVAMLYVIEPQDSQQWKAVEDLMREERRAEAEATIKQLSEQVFEWSGSMPAIFLREGKMREELLKLIEEEPSISILVLAAATGPEGPGPLVTHLAGKIAGRLRIPVTIVPGGLTDEQIAALT
jgi:nucleotide-binding universal stress UspA family protein